MGKKFSLQVRKPGCAYRTMETADTAAELGWAFRQHLSPDGVNSVRVIDGQGKLVARATPKK